MSKRNRRDWHTRRMLLCGAVNTRTGLQARGRGRNIEARRMALWARRNQMARDRRRRHGHERWLLAVWTRRALLGSFFLWQL